MNCPVCNIVMAPALTSHWDGPSFLCSCGQPEDIVTQEQLHDWVQMTMALQLVGMLSIKAFKGEGEDLVERTLQGVGAGLKILPRRVVL